MNYNVLRYFSVLAQVEHYTVAAARLGISQPSLSSAIHNLENALGGVKLFEKVGRNIRLTEEGKFYQEKVDTALQELHTASRMLRDSKLSAPVVIRMGSLRFSMPIDYIYEKAGVILAYRHPPVKKPPAKYPRQAAKSYHYTSVIHKPWRLQYA